MSGLAGLAGLTYFASVLLQPSSTCGVAGFLLQICTSNGKSKKNHFNYCLLLNSTVELE